MVTKINHLLKNWPKGTLAAVSWLEKQGISRQLADSYCQSKWLLRFANGVYIQAGDTVDWKGALYTLQKELSCKIHVAAKTALEMTGMSHYLILGDQPGILFVSTSTRKIPIWFKKHFRKDTTLFFPKSLFDEADVGLQEKDLGNYTILISSPERAILECLYLAPQKISLEYVAELMEKLRTLRPKLIQKLLENCHSIKVKRLFLYLAEIQQQPWLSRLNISQINLGKGKRKIGKGGKYIKKYMISLPKLNKHEGLPEDENKF